MRSFRVLVAGAVVVSLGSSCEVALPPSASDHLNVVIGNKEDSSALRRGGHTFGGGN